MRTPATRRGGFTLAEVAVTLVIVGMTLLLVLEGLTSAKTTAAHASNRKVALGLALETLAWVESGHFWEDLDGLPGTLSGNYAEEGYEAFLWEVSVGEDGLSDYDEPEEGAYFDSVAYERQRRRELRDQDEGAEREPYAEVGSTGGPFEVVTVRVVFPKLGDEPNEVTLQRYVPLDQVYGYPEGGTLPPESEESPE